MSAARCSVDGCERSRHARGLCPMHYQRLRITGDVGSPSSTFRETCTVDGCERPHQCKGYCGTHYSRLRRGSLVEVEPIAERRQRGVECRVEECGKPSFARGYCSMHHSRLQRRGELGGPTSVVNDPRARDEQGRKLCYSCQSWLETSTLPNQRSRPDGLANRCRACVAAAALKGKYGVTPQWVAETLSTQGGGCAICSTTEPGGSGWCVDHDHGCCSGNRTCGNCVRGILCNRCNVMLGMSLDNPETLAAGITYLTKHAA